MAILNRPSSLNVISTSMVSRLNKLYKSWEDHSEIGFVLMKGSGRAFCSGSDVVSLYHLINEGHPTRLVDKEFCPKWDPPRLKDVTKDIVDLFVSPLDEIVWGTANNGAK